LKSKLGIKKGGPRIWAIDKAHQPFVWGWVKGDVYTPVNFIEFKDRGGRMGVMMHELSHVMRRDAAINALQILVQAVFFFHPLVWWANRMIRSEREKCCDEATIALLKMRPDDYSSIIIDSLMDEIDQRKAYPALSVAGSLKSIEKRIKSVMKPGRKFYRRPKLAPLAAAVILAAFSLPAAFAFSRLPVGECIGFSNSDHLDRTTLLEDLLADLKSEESYIGIDDESDQITPSGHSFLHGSFFSDLPRGGFRSKVMPGENSNIFTYRVSGGKVKLPLSHKSLR